MIRRGAPPSPCVQPVCQDVHDVPLGVRASAPWATICAAIAAWQPMAPMVTRQPRSSSNASSLGIAVIALLGLGLFPEGRKRFVGRTADV